MTNNNSSRIAPIRLESIQVILTVKDMEESRAFYIDKLGFTEEEWGSDNFSGIQRDGYGIYLCKDGQGCRGTWVWIGFHGDINALYEQLKEQGVTIRQPPLNFSWALEMHVEDPNGNILRLGTEPRYDEPFVDHQMKVQY